MSAYIVLPNNTVDEVPDRLSGFAEILWPPEANVLSEIQSGDSPPIISSNHLYVRHTLVGSNIHVFVHTDRDPNAIPDAVREEILEREERRRAKE
jgi:hypothetical protein